MNRNTPSFLDRLTDWHLLVIYRIAKTKLRPFFADPRAMVALRDEVTRRGLPLTQERTP
jgi:hypothetical protein